MNRLANKITHRNVIVFLLCLTLMVGAVVTVSADTTSVIPIYRLYNPATGEHLLAGSQSEITALTDAGWTVDGVMCQMPTSGAPIYRLYNPTSGEHLYTMVLSEIETLKNGGWNVDGVIAYSASAEDGTPIYRLYNNGAPAISSHLLSTSQAEMDDLTSQSWVIEGIALYAAAGESAVVAPTEDPTVDPTESTATAPTGSTDPTETTAGGEYTYVLNHNTMKFHRPTCSSVEKIAAEHREDVNDTREAIIAKGFVPCKRCDP